MVMTRSAELRLLVAAGADATIGRCGVESGPEPEAAGSRGVDGWLDPVG